MNTWAYAGRKCVCIEDKWSKKKSDIGDAAAKMLLPMKGNIYTIESVRLKRGKVFLTFFEIPEPQEVFHLGKTYTFRGMRFGVGCFRPLQERKTDISALKRILKTTKQTEKV